MISKVKSFFTTKQSPTWESVKEFLRVLLFGVLSFVLTEAMVFVEDFGSQTTWVVVLLAGLRWADKWLHSSGKLEKGLSRF